MTMTITLGWWIFPAIATFVSYAWAVFTSSQKLGDYGFDIVPLIRIFCATIISLSSWLAFAVCKIWGVV